MATVGLLCRVEARPKEGVAVGRSGGGGEWGLLRDGSRQTVTQGELVADESYGAICGR